LREGEEKIDGKRARVPTGKGKNKKGIWGDQSEKKKVEKRPKRKKNFERRKLESPLEPILLLGRGKKHGGKEKEAPRV